MFRRFAPLILMSTISLTACAPAVWQKPGMTQQDWTTDRYLCERDMRQSGYQDRGLAQIIDGRAFFNRCLEARGYRQVQP